MMNKISTSNKRSRYLACAFIIVLILIPAIIMLTQIVKQAVNTPYQDQWELVTLIEKVDSKSLTVNDLWSLHNQHRILFPRVIMLSAAYVTNWNIGAEMIISWFFALVSLAIVILLILRIKVFNQNRWLAFLAVITAAISIFSFNQVENWLWGWQLEWYLINSCYLLVVLLLTSTSRQWQRTRLAIALCAAIIATYSLAGGQFTWVAGVIILWLQKKSLKIWLAGAVVTLASYYFSYNPVGYQTPLSYSATHPIFALQYFFSYVGRPITSNVDYAYLAGLLGLTTCLITLFVHFKNSKKVSLKVSTLNIVVPMSLIVFALFNAATTTVSRSGLGIATALSSRYITSGMLFWLGLSWLLAIVIDESIKKKSSSIIIINVMMCAFLGLALTASVASVSSFTNETIARRTIGNCTKQVAPPVDCLKSSYPKPDKIRARLLYLKQKHWAGY